MRYLFFPIIALQTLVLEAQDTLPTPRNILSAYNKGTRSITGAPGKNYWQNRADYSIQVNFDPVTRLVTGTADIDYTNNSPDTLRSILFKLYPNLYKMGSDRTMIIKPGDLTNGVKITSISINGFGKDTAGLKMDGTNMTVTNNQLGPHQSMHFSISYFYTLNKGSHIRTGEIDPGADFVAYFFPRIAVYDDIDGWNQYHYTGFQEFYNDFCHFTVSITAPSNQVVWATGNLLNVKDVLNESVYNRLQKAENTDGIVTVIDSTEMTNATHKSGPTNTWFFEADNVTDFVFACSDHYMWHSTSLVVDKKTGRRTRVDAVFNPKHKDYFTVISDARKTVEAMSYSFPAWPYPYPHETVFDGLDQMEYPMMVNDNPVSDHAESVELTDHEIFHTMFPFYMGINETKYAWMDEGWATIGEWIISPIIDSSLVDEYGVKAVGTNAGNETDLPIMTLSTEISRAYFTNSYPKPAMGYLYIRDLLGDELFTKALHHYIEQWHGKHPMPNDFFYSMNEGAGRNLNWFWKKWFFEDGIPDLAISSVKHTGKNYAVMITAKGTKPVPVALEIDYTDNTKENIHRSISVWEKGNRSTVISFNTTRTIKKIILGDPHIPDSYPADNVYEMK